MENNSADDPKVQKAYQAGKEAGRMEILLEMLESLRKDRNKYGPNFAVKTGYVDVNCYQASFILGYLPKRYRAGKLLYWPSSGY